MKIKKLSLLLVLSGAFLLGSCNFNPGPSGDGSSNGQTTSSNGTSDGESTGSSIDWGFSSDIDVSSGDESDFSITSDTENGYTYDKATNTYTIVAAGTYTCAGKLIEGQLVVNAPEDAEIEIDLTGVTISNSTNSPIYILVADQVDISAKSGTENKIYDLRTLDTDETTTLGTGGIYAECDLTIKGKGKLEVISNYNNGIHTKDDLKIKNLTLVSKAVNNSLKGNDSLTIDAAKVMAVSSGGDALKTTSTDLNKNSEQRGVITILADSVVNLYAAQDGIDAASDVVISGGEVNVYTDKYSEYTGDATTTSQSQLYFRIPSSVYNRGYKYSAYFSNTSGGSSWANLTYYKAISSNTGGPGGGGGGMGGPGGGGSSYYYYYTVDKPSNMTSVVFYAYSSSQTQGQSSSYTAKTTANTTIPTTGDTYSVTQVYGTTLVSGGWSSFASSSGGSGLDYSCKGIKADNEINISGGTVNIKSRDDGLHANNENTLESTNATGKGNVNISGGTINIASDDDGVKADQDLTVTGGIVNVTTSYEGYEGNRIYFKGGESTIYGSDDGINASSTGTYSPLVQIEGGTVDVTVPSGDTDTIDSNGKFVMTGGLAIIRNGSNQGQSNTGGTLDTDSGVSVTGGTLISIGQIGNTVSGSKYNTSTSLSAGSYTLTNSSSGAEIASWSLSTTYKAYMFWSDQFVSGQTYNVNRDGNKVVSFTK